MLVHLEAAVVVTAVEEDVRGNRIKRYIVRGGGRIKQAQGFHWYSVLNQRSRLISSLLHQQSEVAPHIWHYISDLGNIRYGRYVTEVTEIT